MKLSHQQVNEAKAVANTHCYNTQRKTSRFGSFSASISHITVRDTADPADIEAIRRLLSQR
jgi:hypothetical protein